MINVLRSWERALPIEGWIYQRVIEEYGLTFDRLWQPIGGGARLWLHRMPASGAVPFVHAHPWRMAVHVLGPGPYRMDLYARGVLGATLEMTEGYYTLEPVFAHGLQLQGPSYSVMYTEPVGMPVQQSAPLGPVPAAELRMQIEALFGTLSAM